jgi:hypothetical protein
MKLKSNRKLGVSFMSAVTGSIQTYQMSYLCLYQSQYVSIHVHMHAGLNKFSFFTKYSISINIPVFTTLHSLPPYHISNTSSQFYIPILNFNVNFEFTLC